MQLLNLSDFINRVITCSGGAEDDRNYEIAASGASLPNDSNKREGSECLNSKNKIDLQYTLYIYSYI